MRHDVAFFLFYFFVTQRSECAGHLTLNGLTLWMQKEKQSRAAATSQLRWYSERHPTQNQKQQIQKRTRTNPLIRLSLLLYGAKIEQPFFLRFVKECQLANDYDDLSLVGVGKKRKMSTPVSSWLKSNDAKIKSARQSTSRGSNIHPQPSESHVDLEKDDSLCCVVNVPYSAVA